MLLVTGFGRRAVMNKRTETNHVGKQDGAGRKAEEGAGKTKQRGAGS